MSANPVTLHGQICADGTLVVSDKVRLPPGPVEVTVRPLAAKGEDLLALLARVRTEQAASGHAPRTAAEIDAEVRRMRDEWEDHQLAVERIQDACSRGNGEPQP